MPSQDFSDTSHLHIEFFTKAVEDKKKSRAEGRPIFKDVEFVRIRWAGDRNRMLVAPAHDKFARAGGEHNEMLTYAQVYPKHYAAFREGMEIASEGTPIEQLPFLTKARIEELKRQNVRTAEQLAHLDGTLLTNLGMGARPLKEQAQAYLANAAGSADTTRLAAENTELRDAMQIMQQQIDQMQAQVNPPAPQPVPAENGGEVGALGPFDEWPDSQIRSWLKGLDMQVPPRIARENLVKMANEAYAANPGKLP